MDGSGTLRAAETTDASGTSTVWPGRRLPDLSVESFGLYQESCVEVKPYFRAIVASDCPFFDVTRANFGCAPSPSAANALSKPAALPAGTRTKYVPVGGVMPRRMCGLSS